MRLFRIRCSELARAICRDVDRISDSQHFRWVPLEKIEDHLGIEPETSLGAARYGVLKNWLRLEERPVPKVMLRLAGRKEIADQQRRQIEGDS